MTQSERVEIDVKEVRRTEHAILVSDADDKEFWLPLSQVEVLEDDSLDSILRLSIPEWLAAEKGLI